MNKSGLPPIPKSFKQRISDEIGKLLIKGYCMTSDVCSLCGTILMQDRQKKFWCVYCSFLKEPSKNIPKSSVQQNVSTNECKSQELSNGDVVANVEVKVNKLPSNKDTLNEVSINLDCDTESQKGKLFKKQEPKVCQSMTKEMKNNISNEIGKLLLKGYSMRNETCPFCQTIFMQDRSKRNWCVYCDVINKNTIHSEYNRKLCVGNKIESSVNNKNALVSKVREKNLLNDKTTNKKSDSLIENSNPPKVQSNGDPLLRFKSLADNIMNEASADETIYQSTQVNYKEHGSFVTQEKQKVSKNSIRNEKLYINKSLIKSSSSLPITNGSSLRMQNVNQVDLPACLNSMEMKINNLSCQLQAETDFSKIITISEAIKSCCEAAASLKSYIDIKA